MAQLVIKGHPTRGNEIIEILRMFGGKLEEVFSGNVRSGGYYIDSNGHINCRDTTIFDDAIIYTLEEFLEKFPYKVGDKVLYKIYGIHSKIRSMLWNKEKEQVFYRLESNKLFVATADELKPL